MSNPTILGRAASCLESFGAAVCLTLVASGFLLATDARAAPQTATTAPTAVARAEGDGPALWVIRDADSTIYLFGTVHMLKPGTAWGSDKVDAAFESASDIWMEVADPSDQSAIPPLIQRFGLSPERPLSSWLTPQEQQILASAAQAAGMNAQQIDPFRPWFAALMIATGPLTTAGFDPAFSVEINLRARAQAANKPIHGLETVEQQIGGLARMSDDGQETYLRHYLQTYDTVAADLDRAVAGWIAGDQIVMADFANDNGRAISEETHQIFLASRNADWAEQVETLLAGAGTSFIAVGAAHLAGEDSLQKKLADRGIAVTRQ